MFLNVTALKKILTNSYKSTGLTVGRTETDLIVCNTYMGFQVDNDFVPNKLKGILAELIGDLPEEGEFYTYSKEGKQAEMEFDRFNFYKRWKDAKGFAVKTPIMIAGEGNGDYRLMQTSTGNIVAISERIVDLISYKSLEKTENLPGRPSFANGIFYWKNETTILFSGGYNLREEITNLLFPALEKFQFTEKTIGIKEDAESKEDELPYI